MATSDSPVLVDTNVLVSATLVRAGNEDRILRAWRRGSFELVLSQEILEELGRALLYEKLRRYRWMSEQEVIRLLEFLASESLLVPGKLEVTASRDPEDDKFLAAALEGDARYVVSGGRDLLELKRYRNIHIIRPAAFVKLL